MAFPDTLNELVVYTGRILLTLFLSWWSDNIEIPRGDLAVSFQKNISNSITLLLTKNDNYKKLGLERLVDLEMLIKAFFYSSSTERIWKSKNLASEHTFLELWDLFDSTLKLTEECNRGNQSMLCTIHNTLLNDQGRLDRVQDFRVSEKLFLGQFYSKWPLIGRNIYSTDKQIDGFTKSSRPWRRFNYPTVSQFNRYLINKSLKLKDLGLPDYGLWRSDPFYEIDYEKPFFTLITSDLNKTNLPYVINQDVNNIRYQEGFVIWPGVPLKEEGWHTLISLDNQGGNKLASFYPYTPQCFNVTNNITYNEKDYDLGDRYYRIEEEKLLGGYKKEYKKMWVFGDLNYGLIRNLTSFVFCLNQSSYAFCLEEHLTWYKGCIQNEDHLCTRINELLQNLTKKEIKKNKWLIGLTFGLCSFTILLILINLGFFLKKLKMNKKNKEIYEEV